MYTVHAHIHSQHVRQRPCAYQLTIRPTTLSHSNNTHWGPYLGQVTCCSPQSCDQLWQHIVARTVEFSLQPLSLVLCQLNLHARWRETVVQVPHSHATQGSSAHACTASLSILPLAPPQSTCYLCPACSQSHLARLGKLLAQCSQVNRTAWASQTVFEGRTYDSTMASTAPKTYLCCLQFAYVHVMCTWPYVICHNICLGWIMFRLFIKLLSLRAKWNSYSLCEHHDTRSNMKQ